MELQDFIGPDEKYRSYPNLNYEVAIEVVTSSGSMFEEEAACFSRFRKSVRAQLEWQHSLSYGADTTLEHVLVAIDAPVLHTYAAASFLTYMQTAPQYGGYLSFKELEDSFQMRVDGSCPTQAAVHAMRTFTSARENPVSVYLFHCLTSEGYNPDLVFRMVTGVSVHDADLRWGMPNEGHSVVCGLPTQKREVTRLVKRWKKVRPYGDTLMDVGYGGIDHYAVQYHGHTQTGIVTYEQLQEICNEQRD